MGFKPFDDGSSQELSFFRLHRSLTLLTDARALPEPLTSVQQATAQTAVHSRSTFVLLPDGLYAKPARCLCCCADSHTPNVGRSRVVPGQHASVLSAPTECYGGRRIQLVTFCEAAHNRLFVSLRAYAMRMRVRFLRDSCGCENSS